MIARALKSAFALLPLCLGIPAHAQDKVLNLYSSRHYQTDEALYEGFTRATGIRINRIEAGDDALIERIRSEGTRSPADILITVDAGRLWRAEQLGFFQPVKSSVLESRIPAAFREPNGHWFGFSLRSRVIAYQRAKVKPEEIASYESLADPKWKGRICTRSASHVYSLSLLSALIHHLGEARAEAWAKALKGNLAREPRGGDTDQIRAVAAGECDLAITNDYYFGRLLRSEKPEDRAVAERVGMVYPDQAGTGTHVNISGAGVLRHAPNREAAIRFLEYLTSDEAQRHFADGNNERPVVPGVKVANPVYAANPGVRMDSINVALFGRNQPLAQKIYDRNGWK